MSCVTGKIPFVSKAIALEGLIQNHIRHHHREGTGPQNVYQCDDCGQWHFTSQPPVADILSDPEIKRRIALEKNALDWERKLR